MRISRSLRRKKLAALEPLLQLGHYRAGIGRRSVERIPLPRAQVLELLPDPFDRTRGRKRLRAASGDALTAELQRSAQHGVADLVPTSEERVAQRAEEPARD